MKNKGLLGKWYNISRFFFFYENGGGVTLFELFISKILWLSDDLDI